jgi:hypothetical protein
MGSYNTKLWASELAQKTEPGLTLKSRDQTQPINNNNLTNQGDKLPRVNPEFHTLIGVKISGFGLLTGQYASV